VKNVNPYQAHCSPYSCKFLHFFYFSIRFVDVQTQIKIVQKKVQVKKNSLNIFLGFLTDTTQNILSEYFTFQRCDVAGIFCAVNSHYIKDTAMKKLHLKKKLICPSRY